jgi:hypothetical protein
MTIALGAATWMIWRGTRFSAAGSTTTDDDGPLRWFYNLTLEGGPLSKSNVFSLNFYGTNASQKEVRLKTAAIISALKGTELPLEIIAENEIVPIGAVNLVPPGAPIQLIAKFNLPNGLPDQEFLATWSRFSLVITDDTKEYRKLFNEGNLAPFFPGMVGPHITKKASTIP